MVSKNTNTNPLVNVLDKTYVHRKPSKQTQHELKKKQSKGSILQTSHLLKS